MRIAMITDTYWPRVNGVAMSVDAFRKELGRLGHQVVVLCPRYPAHDGDPVTDEAGVQRFASFNPLVSKEDRLVRAWEQRRVFAFLDQFAPDVVHIQTELALGNMGRRWGVKRGKPVVITSHTYFEKYVKFYVPWLPARITEAVTRGITSRALGAADLVVVPSEAMKRVLVGYGIQKPFRVIPTGLNPDDFAGVDKAREKASSSLYGPYPRLRGRKILLFVGRVGQEKNLDFLLDVVRALKPRFPGFTLLMVGDGPYRKTIEALAVREGLEEQILMAGYIDRSEIRHAYALADVFVFASKTETQGMVTIEAMLCGTPVVAIGEMGTREVMGGDNGGFMVPDDVGAFTDRVGQLLSDDALLREKSEEAGRYAQNWLIGAMAQKLARTYQEAIDAKAVKTPV